MGSTIVMTTFTNKRTGEVLTEEQYKAKFGKPVFSSVTKEDSKSFLTKAASFTKDTAKEAFESLLIKPAVRTGEAVGALGIEAFGTDEMKQRAADYSSKDKNINLGLLGEYNIEGVKSGVSGAKQIVGEGLEAASYLIPGGSASKVVTTGLRQGIKQGVIQGTKVGAMGGGAMGAGNALQEDKGLGEVAVDTAIGAGIGAIGGGVIGGAVPAAIGGVRAVNKGGAIIKEGIQKSIQPIKNVVAGTKNVVGMVAEETRRLPSRIATNVAEKQATRETINQLPTNVAKEAAQDGLDVVDVQALYKIPASQKAPLKRLAQVVRDFAGGKTKINPIEVIGKPIVARVKQLTSQLGKVGQKLGSLANKLGKISGKESFTSVYNSLKGVRGLEGIKVSPKGELDFSGTVLATAETAADRAAIQRIFSVAIKEASGKSKHLLRQELFEALGGKKRAKLNLTATQEKAYEAIRKGLSDVLEGKNSGYKALSNEYRKIIQPLQEIRGYMKKVAGADEDILEMSAGLLARRLTSLAKSNPEIRATLRALDNATKVPGKSTLSIEALQDFYNILEKYYDIAPKTGFQAQIRQGVEKATGLGDLAMQKLQSFAGETPAVRQKALERILDEVFK